MLAGADRVVVLEDLVDTTNVGAIIRSAAALGWDAVVLSPRCGDPLYRRAVRTSMGAVFSVPWTRVDHRSGIEIAARRRVRGRRAHAVRARSTSARWSGRPAVRCSSAAKARVSPPVAGRRRSPRADPDAGAVDSLNVVDGRGDRAVRARLSRERPLLSPRARGDRPRLPRHRRRAVRRPGVRRGVAAGAPRGGWHVHRRGVRGGVRGVPSGAGSFVPRAPGDRVPRARRGSARVGDERRPATGTTRRRRCTPTSCRRSTSSATPATGSA